MNYYRSKTRVWQMISLPIVFSVFIPILFLDICLEIYHRTCFRLYELPYIKRSEYIKIDRHKLEYLNFLEKVGCAYCSYANGFAAYFVAIAAETEQYWCGIMHQKSKGFKEPAHHKNFVPYGDKEAFEKRYR